MNSARIQTDQQSKIAALVEYMEKNPAAKVNVTGYADKETGNPVINLKLSEARAKNVAEALKAKGISSDRIAIDFKGDTVQPYSTPKENISPFLCEMQFFPVSLFIRGNLTVRIYGS